MRPLPLLVLITAIAFMVSPLFVPDFGGYAPEQFPNPMTDPPAQPAGYAFAIWGVIYLWLAVMAVFGLLRRADDPAWEPTRTPLILSMGVGAIWLAVAVASPIWATVLIWVMLATALWAVLNTPGTDLWLLRAPVGLYAGWLTAASCVALGITLPGFGVPPFGPVGWAIAALILALVIAVAVQKRRVSLMYGVAVCWALIGVIVQNGLNAVGLFAGGAAIFLALLTLHQLGKSRRAVAG
ncbi:hypothetical protein [Jannaschia pohangensis]|uniref:TspO and MBR related proteins n=1 Tax=Jannaschia pohangensis TaxID=390807 RepID=A0A1I3JTQ6_9RHOB|nr:hypothetical protein [Jannaschia pohangensis]SFI63647.1 hypothetical protein SAMN04488095_1428 [Jannaschia pohangensis]